MVVAWGWSKGAIRNCLIGTVSVGEDEEILDMYENDSCKTM